MKKFRRWWHAGEEGALAVHTRPFRARVLLLCIVIVACWAYFPVMQKYPLCLLLAALLAVPRSVAEGRRAIVFTDTEVRYRPPFAEPWRVRMADIQSLKPFKVTLFTLSRPHRVPGILLTMSGGESIALPLDFMERDEIVQRITAATGKVIV
jgi:hypothetical protein